MEFLNQQITSAKTSQHQIPAIYNKYDFKKGKIIFDYGCGKYFEDIKKFIKDKYQCPVIGFDPFNRTLKQNNKALSLANKLSLDYITCANVLNVIKEKKDLNEILDNIYNLANDNTIIIFGIYEGNKTGIGRLTKQNCWQRNEKTLHYIKYLESSFNIIKIRSSMIIVSKKEIALEEVI